MRSKPMLFVRALLVGAACAIALGAPTFPRSATETVLYSFDYTPNGWFPMAGLIADASGALYGTTFYGGRGPCGHQCGTVYKLTPSGSGYVEKVIWKFEGRDGGNPTGPVAEDGNGNLYGTTEFGGSECTPDPNEKIGCGTVFELTPNGEKYSRTVLHKFCPTNFPCADGAMPKAGLTSGPDGVLYGTASISRCGYRNLCHGGKIFALVPSGSGYEERVLRNVDQPTTGLLRTSSGEIYGTTSRGGKYTRGSVFKLTPHNGQFEYTLIWSFNVGKGDGVGPSGTLIIDRAGNLYGTTTNGGNSTDGGIVYRLTPGASGYTETVLYDFCSQPDCADGEVPQGGVIMDKSGALYGTTTYSWATGYYMGVVFKMTPSSSGYAYSILHNFCDPHPGCGDGANPIGGLIMDNAGALYGVTQAGGNRGTGVVFKVTQ